MPLISLILELRVAPVLNENVLVIALYLGQSFLLNYCVRVVLHAFPEEFEDAGVGFVVGKRNVFDSDYYLAGGVQDLVLLQFLKQNLVVLVLRHWDCYVQFVLQVITRKQGLVGRRVERNNPDFELQFMEQSHVFDVFLKILVDNDELRLFRQRDGLPFSKCIIFKIKGELVKHLFFIKHLLESKLALLIVLDYFLDIEVEILLVFLG